MSTVAKFMQQTPTSIPADWDVIVIGAGPAGSLASRQLAACGLNTLLIDAKTFPRDKVCGGYLNPRAVHVLTHLGLISDLLRHDSATTHEFELITTRKRARFHLPPGRVICRSSFDNRLLKSAEAEGVTILCGAQAVVEPPSDREFRSVTVTQNNVRQSYRAGNVVCADGLSRTSIRHLSEFPVETSPVSRVGIGAVVDDNSDLWPASDITMVVARHGYVGISRIDGERLNVAAAVEPSVLSHATPAEVASDILAAAGVPVPVNLAAGNWRGTPPLTSRPLSVASQRVFLIGDSGGYIEPFTGEGMAAALESAVAIAPILVEAVRCWTTECATQWQELHQRLVFDQGATCRKLAWILRRPWATSLAMTACRWFPELATGWIIKTTRPMSMNSLPILATT